jgi:hypothetical protein
MDETVFFNLRSARSCWRTHRVPLDNLLSFTWPERATSTWPGCFRSCSRSRTARAAYRRRCCSRPPWCWPPSPCSLVAGGAAPRRPCWRPLALAAWAAEPRFVERPHLVTFLGSGAGCWRWSAPRTGARARWALLPAGLVWANANSCFFLAPVLLALYALGALLDDRGADARLAGLVALALAPIVLATPSGVHALGYIANHFRMPSLRPLQEYRTAAWPVDGPFFFLMAALATAIALAPRGRWRTFLPSSLGLLGAPSASSPKALLAARRWRRRSARLGGPGARVAAHLSRPARGGARSCWR